MQNLFVCCHLQGPLVAAAGLLSHQSEDLTVVTRSRVASAPWVVSISWNAAVYGRQGVKASPINPANKQSGGGVGTQNKSTRSEARGGSDKRHAVWLTAQWEIQRGDNKALGRHTQAVTNVEISCTPKRPAFHTKIRSVHQTNLYHALFPTMQSSYVTMFTKNGC